MDVANARSEIIRFATYEVHPRAGEIRKAGVKLRLSEQPFQLLLALLEKPGDVLTREELQKRLWPGTFVDVDGSLNAAINKIREVLGDSAENPRFVETVPRRGYRFIGPVEGASSSVQNAPISGDGAEARKSSRVARTAVAVAACTVLAGAGWLVYNRRQVPAPPLPHTLTRLTLDDGLQIGATWSPDSRYIAYSSDRGGKFDIWVQQLSGGDPLQITKGPGQHWQPEWSPDGRYIAYRSEEDGGLYIVPALGGAGRERKIASFGYYPRWSPDSSQILFRTTQFDEINRFYVVSLDGGGPREVLTQFRYHGQVGVSANAPVWHPDGKRVSAWLSGLGQGLHLWTGPLEQGAGVRSEIAPSVAKQLEELGYAPIVVETPDDTFAWDPSGRAIYLQAAIRGVLNIWKLSVDPATLKITAMERLTTGAGPDGELALSPDGKKLAFTAETQKIRTWLYPFDEIRGEVTGTGQAVSPAGMATWRHNVSRDGTKMAFSSNHAGKFELWKKSLIDGSALPIAADKYLRDDPKWSPDGKQLVYNRVDLEQRKVTIVVWSEDRHNEIQIARPGLAGATDWSPDGKSLLVWDVNAETNRPEIQLWETSAAPHAEAGARKIAAEASSDLWQPQMSPDGRWIVFEAVRDLPDHLDSVLWVIPASGGTWTRITDGSHWDDKPRWSLDGKCIYFVSGRSGFFNIWGIRFDPQRGKPVGEPFAVTKFSTPAFMIPQHVPSVDFSIASGRLAMTGEQVSGSVWVLDNVDR